VVTGEISPYRGPGTYQKASIVSVGPSIVVGTASYNLLAAGATVTVTFTANGSGELTFSGAAAAKAGQPALSVQSTGPAPCSSLRPAKFGGPGSLARDSG